MKRDLLVAVVIVLMYIAERVDDIYTRHIYNHKELPHGWDQ